MQELKNVLHSSFLAFAQNLMAFFTSVLFSLQWLDKVLTTNSFEFPKKQCGIAEREVWACPQFLILPPCYYYVAMSASRTSVKLLCIRVTLISQRNEAFPDVADSQAKVYIYLVM